MTGLVDDTDLPSPYTESLKVEAHDDAEVSALGSLHEENEVLRFLLGKMPSIKSDDTSSATSTSSSSHSTHSSHENAAGADWNSHQQHVRGCESLGVVGVDTPPPELEPICESASEDDKTDSCSSPRKLTLRVISGFDSPSVYARVVQWTHVFTAKPGSLEARCPSPKSPKMEMETMDRSNVQCQTTELQPEDENDGTMEASTGLRERRRSSSVSDSKSTPKARPREAAKAPTLSQKRLHILSPYADSIFVATVLAVLVGYCLAIVYRFAHPVVYPLPNVDALFKPWNLSNVVARFASPIREAEYMGAVPIQWQLLNFPADAIREGGVEPFEYRVFLDGRQIQFEVGYLSCPETYTDALLNETIQHRLRPRDIDGSGRHELRLEVTLPIPGSDGEVHTMTETTAFTVAKPATSEPMLKIKAPVDGTVIKALPEMHALLLEFEAHNVDRVDVILDSKSRLSPRHWNDGNLLLRGVGVGSHVIAVEGFDEHGKMVVKQTTRIEVREES